MSKYTTMKGPHNSLRYKKDGKMISPKDIPENILQVLQTNPVFNEEAPAEVRNKSCIFCGMYSNIVRLVNLQSVALCEEHYYSQSLGTIAQHLKEQSSEEQTP